MRYDLLQILGLEETIDHLAIANSVHWYGHVLGKDKNDVPRNTINVMVKGSRKRD